LIYFQVLNFPSFLQERNVKIKKKRKLFKDYLFIFLNTCFQRLRKCCHYLSILSLFRNLDLLPFRYNYKWYLTYHLGSTHPYSITVFMEPFSTSVFKFYTLSY